MAGGGIDVTRHPLIIVISGPSGVGKSTIVDRTLAEYGNARRSVSLTTRAPRNGERDGEDYFFVTEEEFARRRDAGELLEWARVHGHLYGTPAAFVDEQLEAGHEVLLEIDVQGGMTVNEKRPDALLVFLLPPSLEDLERRLRGRGTDDEGNVRRRLEMARWELGFYDRYDYILVNDDVASCVRDVLDVIRAGSLRRDACTVVMTDAASGRGE